MLGPRSMEAGTPTHQNSTKLLINRFETLGTPPLPARSKSTRKQQYVYYDYTLHTPDEPQKKEKSPIRRSIKNLLSVLKKGTSGLSKKSDDNDKPHLERSEAETSSLSSTNKVKETFRSRKKQTGSLLYLTRQQTSLAWTTCNVTLEENRLGLASFTSNMELCIHQILLSNSTDIHSLSPVQLDADEAALLDSVADSGKMHFFEILFEGRPAEKFAAKTVRERAAWISAIWDVILPGKYKDTDPSVSVIPDYGQDKQNTELPSPIDCQTPTPDPGICSLPSSSYSDRSLPPLPPKAFLPPLQIPSTPPKSGIHHLHPDIFSPSNTPISPSIYPPTSRPTSSIGSPNTLPPFSPSSIAPIESSRPNSPSIKNLSQLSVVRQRLAQIERNHSELSAQNGSTTRASTPVSPSSCSAWSRQEALWYNPRTSPRSDAVTLRGGNSSSGTSTSHVRKKTRRMETERSLPEGEVLITDPLDNILTQHGCLPVPTQTLQRDRVQDHEGLEKSSLTPVLQDLTKISKDLNDVKGVLGGANGYPTIHQMVVGLDRCVQGDGQTLRAIQDSLNSLGERVATVYAVQEQQTRKQDRKEKRDQKQQPVQARGTEELRLLENIQSQLSSVFPSVVGKLTQIVETQEKEKQQEQQLAYRDIGGTHCDAGKTAEMEAVLEKLEEIRKLCPDGPASSREGGDGTKPPEYIDKILSFVDDERQKRGILMQQQADSVRYLNELNMWLEAFVNNGTSQIQGLATNIDQLCKELGCNSQQQQQLPGVHRVPEEGGPPTLLTDIRQLVLGMQARDQNFASLQAAVHGLLDVLSVSHAQKGADSKAIAGLIDRQRLDQEMLFRAFTDEISGEIKGERLRFVEAMKEATAINVQTHVEQFKQELNREVMNMTEEVGRLHREKQVVENQISDLFAFYTKQKSAATPLENNHVNGPPARQLALPPPAQERARANIPRSLRPLPYPRHL